MNKATPRETPLFLEPQKKRIYRMKKAIMNISPDFRMRLQRKDYPSIMEVFQALAKKYTDLQEEPNDER